MSKQSDSSVKKNHSDTKNESMSSTPNSSARKISFKTHRSAITSGYYSNRKNVNNGSKVAQITQRFNQLSKSDVSLIKEVVKRDAAKLFQVNKIKEGKSSISSNEKSSNEEISDQASDFRSSSVSRRSKRKKSSLGKRPSIKILVAKNAISGNVLSKRQLYETNILSKARPEKPKVPEKSQQVLAKTKEIKQKKLMTENSFLPETSENQQSTTEVSKNVVEIQDKIPVQPSFLYGKKTAEIKVEDAIDENDLKKSNFSSKEDEKEVELADMNIYSFFSSKTLSEPNDASTVDKNCEKPKDAKANESFLFRTQLSCSKLETSISDIDPKESNSKNDSKPYEEIGDLKDSNKNHSNELPYDFEEFEPADNFECSTLGEENIYQSLCEVKLETESIKSYESFENYDEIAQNILDNKISLSDLMMNDDTYILPDKAPEPPPPRKNTSPKISSPILTSTTSQQVVSQSSVVNKDLYEKFSYKQFSILKQGSKFVDNKHIYDTIQNRFRVDDNSWKETISRRSEWKNLSMKESNCYESISLNNSSYSTINQILRHAISSQTLSSEQFRINSIYGHSLTPASEISDNSDDWVDLSDEDDHDTDKHIIV